MKPYIDKTAESVTSYDLIKSFAIYSMIIDHIGYYFMPEDLTLRAVTITMPIWLFLIGYANTRDITPKLAGAAVLVALINFISGLGLFAFNILFAIIIVRLVIDPLARITFRHRETCIASFLLLTILIVPTQIFVEYGTQTLFWALLGVAVRGWKDEKRTYNGLLTRFFRAWWQIVLLGFICLAVFCGVQIYVFGYEGMDIVLLVAFTFLSLLICLSFRPYIFRQSFGIFTPFLKLTGRYTLEIYVVHIFVFSIIAIILGMPGVSFLDFRLF